MISEAYLFADWQAGKPPPKGWDAADAVADGWSKADLDDFMRATVRPWSPPDPGKEKPAPKPEKPLRAPVRPLENDRVATHGPPPGAEGIASMGQIVSVDYGSEVELARIFASRLSRACGGRVVRADGKFWTFGPTAWQEISDQQLRLAVHRFDGANVGPRGTPLKISKRMIDGVLSEVGTILSEPGFFEKSTIGLNAQNGVITIEPSCTIKVRPHDPEDRFRFTIPAEFHPHTEMIPPEGSMLHRLLHGAFASDHDAAAKVNLVGEILGSAAFGFATRLPQPKAFVFLGETASNGKSTIASLLACLLPSGSVSSIPPSVFNDERRIINLAGKAANVADELSAASVAGETFKAAITGNPIAGRDLYRSAVTFVPRALHCFTTNTLPRFNGGLDRGLRRRLMVLRFNRSIPESEIIPDIADRIRNEELDLLLGFAVAGAQRLTRSKAYTEPASSRTALKEWLLLDPVNEWFEDRIVATSEKPLDGWPRTVDLHADFKRWAAENGYAERFLPPVNTFGQRLKALPGVDVRRTDAPRAHGVRTKQAGSSDGW